MVLRCIVLVFCLVGFAVWGSAPAAAQKLLESVKKDLPEVPRLAEADFIAATQEVEETPQGVTALKYSMRLPKKWKKIEGSSFNEVSLKPKVLSEVVRYVGGADLYGEYPYFTLDALKLDYDITAEQWLAMYIVENNLASQGFLTHTEKRAEAVYFTVNRAKSHIVRAVAVRNGNVMALARFYIPEEEWGVLREKQAQSIESFKLLTPVEYRPEAMNSVPFLDVSQAEYPKSWELQLGSMKSIDRMDITLLNIRQHEAGRIRSLEGKVKLHVVSSYIVKDFESEIEAFKNISAENMTLVEELSDVPQWTYGEHVAFANNSVFLGQRTQENVAKDFELWVSVLGVGEYFYLASLMTPSRDVDYTSWARNTQSFEAILRSIKTVSDSGVYAE
ncbi:MAG: hypothetical protein ACRBCT_09015 [Alphaproteobacteria bacterium]